VPKAMNIEKNAKNVVVTFMNEFINFFVSLFRRFIHKNFDRSLYANM